MLGDSVASPFRHSDAASFALGPRFCVYGLGVARFVVSSKVLIRFPLANGEKSANVECKMEKAHTFEGRQK